MKAVATENKHQANTSKSTTHWLSKKFELTPFDQMRKWIPEDFWEKHFEVDPKPQRAFLFPALIFFSVTKGRYKQARMRELFNSPLCHNFELIVLEEEITLRLDMLSRDEPGRHELSTLTLKYGQDRFEIMVNSDWEDCHLSPCVQYQSLNLSTKTDKIYFYLFTDICRLLSELEGDKEGLLHRPIDDSGPSVSYDSKKV